MKLALLLLGSFLVGVTILSRIRSASWWMRYADFPRMQIGFTLFCVLAAYIALYGIVGTLDAVFALDVAGSPALSSSRVSGSFPTRRLRRRRLRTPNQETARLQSRS
jgi:hypothetical protein